MKYQEGNIVLLSNGKTASIFSVNTEEKSYQVIDTNDESKLFVVHESDINMLLT